MNMLANATPTMTSSQLAEMLGYEKKEINRKVKSMFEDKIDGGIISPSLDARGYVSEFNLPELESKMFVAKHDIQYLEMITQYWIDKKSISTELPNKKALALMVIQAEEEKEAALLLVEEKSRQVESLENLFHNGGTIAQFAKQLNGVNSQKINHWLYTNTKWIYDDNKGKVDQYGREKAHAWRCGSYARDKYLTETNYNVDRQGSESIVKYEVQLLANGKKWLFKKYTDGKLPMKTTWNGEFTHEKDLA